MTKPILRELILLRHGKSDWKNNLLDIDRPLDDRGKKAVLKMRGWLKEQDLLPDLILTSPAKRTLQTLNRINPDGSISSIQVKELYLANLNTLLKVLAETPAAERVLIIGHNPGLEQLLAFLSQAQIESNLPSDTKLFPTAALAHFIMPENWQSLSAGQGKLSQLIRPKDLKLH